MSFFAFVCFDLRGARGMGWGLIDHPIARAAPSPPKKRRHSRWDVFLLQLKSSALPSHFVYILYELFQSFHTIFHASRETGGTKIVSRSEEFLSKLCASLL
jgi:hypothetical protein